MKILNFTWCIATASLILGGLISTPSVASAKDFTPVKGSERLMKIETVGDLQKVEVGDTIIMSCPKCKDTYATVVDKTLKGHIQEEKTTVIHLCPTCETRFVFTAGQGKQAKDKLVHTCMNCGSTDVSCCLLKKNGGATPGMEKK